MALAPLPLIAASSAVAQNEQGPLIPGLEGFNLSGPRARAPQEPAASPTPRPTPAARATPVARPTPAPRAAPTATPAPTNALSLPAPENAGAEITPPPLPPLAEPTPLPLPPSIDATADRPAIRPSPVPVTKRAMGGSGISPWLVMLGILLLLGLLGLAAYLFRRPRAAPAEPFEIEIELADSGLGATADFASIAPLSSEPLLPDVSDLPPADAFPPAPPQTALRPASPAPSFLRVAQPEAPRARIDFVVRAIRAGTNLTSAAVDYEVDIRNSGEADAIGIRLDLRLLSASADQDRILAALYGAPIERPVVVPFDVPAGEKVSLGGMVMLPNEALSVISMQGRDFFVPLLSLNLIYGWGTAAAGQTACAYVIGIERGDATKMAPFRLDTGPRMFDQVGARQHTLTVNR